MIWAAAAMGAYTLFADTIAETGISGTSAMIGLIAKDMLGSVGGIIAIIGVIVLPISTGDTALRSLRLIIGDFFKIDQTKKRNRFGLSGILCVIILVLLLFSKLNAEGFSILWRYFAWSNQTIAIFAFALITVYLYKAKKPWWISLIPGMFYAFIVSTYIFNAKIGFNIPITIAYVMGVIFAGVYGGLILFGAKKSKLQIPE